MYHRRITTAFVFMILFTVIELICASIAWKAFGKSLWDKLHDAFAMEPLTAEELPQDQPQQETSTQSHHTDDDEYLTEE